MFQLPDLAALPAATGPILSVALGIALVLVGRRLFWLAVGLAGFAAGLYAAQRLLDLQPWWLQLAAASLVGLFGALLAVFLQRLMVGFAGFAAGGWLAIELWRLTGQGTGGLAWIFFFLAGVAAAILAMLLFEYALMAVTSLAGAALIVGATRLGPPEALILTALIAAAGTLIQASFRRRRRRD
jgi:hypothetical protein